LRKVWSLWIRNREGKEVVTLVDKKQKAGEYLCRLKVEGDRLKVARTRKMVLLR